MKIKLMTIATFLIVVILALAAYVVFIQPNISGAPGLKTGSIIGTNATPTPPPVTGVAAGQPEPLSIYASNSLAGSNIGTATLKVYNSQLQLTDTLTTSNGVISTASLWTPGQTGYINITESGYVQKMVAFTVPSVATAGQYNAPSYYIPISDRTLGTYAIHCYDQFGNAITNASAENFTTVGSTSVTLSFTIYNSAVNTGYITSYDAVNNVNQACGIAMNTAGSSVSVPSGLQGLTSPAEFPRGSSTYWSAIIPDAGLNYAKTGTTITSNGQTAFSLTVNQGALTHAASAQVFDIYITAPFDQAYYQANGNGGPNAATLYHFEVSFAA